MRDAVSKQDSNAETMHITPKLSIIRHKGRVMVVSVGLYIYSTICLNKHFMSLYLLVFFWLSSQ